MIAVSKIVCILACGFILGVGLSAQSTWAGDGTKVFHPPPRIGGQAGQPYDHLKPASVQPVERVERQAGERIGGQAGQLYDHVKHEYASVQPEERIGGQAGESYSLTQLK